MVAICTYRIETRKEKKRARVKKELKRIEMNTIEIKKKGKRRINRGKECK